MERDVSKRPEQPGFEVSGLASATISSNFTTHHAISNSFLYILKPPVPTGLDGDVKMVKAIDFEETDGIAFFKKKN